MIKRRSLNIETVRLDDHNSIGMKSKAHALPCLDRFLHDIAIKQSDKNEAFGRKYQREVILTSGLEIVSPFSGKPAIARHSIDVRGRVFFRFAEEGGEYYVASSRIKVGYPLSALFVPNAGLVLKWDPVQGGIERIHIKLLKSLIDAPVRTGSKGVPTVVMGHRNFAHHLWNELSALERLLDEHALPDPRPKIIVAREPLGAIEAIFPELRGWVIERARTEDGGVRNNPDTLFVNLGGYCISSQLRRRIVRHAQAAASVATNSLLKEIGEHCSPVFWLSIRTNNPTFVNQRDVLVSIARLILSNYPTCCIMFDGFSLPQDWKNTKGEMLGFYTSSIDLARLEIDSIIASIRSTCVLTSSQRMFNVGGLELLDSISLAQIADCYFCHLGTIQHKIAWTSNKPGIIHGNRAILASKPEIWHATALEAGTQPLAVDRSMIADITAGRKSGDYRAVDCAALAEWVVQYFDTRILAENRSGPP
jgi:hypothetical protein